jgi:hypothetical protein
LPFERADDSTSMKGDGTSRVDGRGPGQHQSRVRAARAPRRRYHVLCGWLRDVWHKLKLGSSAQTAEPVPVVNKEVVASCNLTSVNALRVAVGEVIGAFGEVQTGTVETRQELEHGR